MLRQRVICLDGNFGNGSDSSTGGVPTGDDQFNAVAFAVRSHFQI